MMQAAVLPQIPAPIGVQELQRRVPSLFAQSPHHRTSSKYEFIPTTRVLDALLSNGWFVSSAVQSRTRALDRHGFQKHMIRLRNNSYSPQKLGDTVPELLLINSHDGSSSFTFHAALMRLVCMNGLIVGDTTLSSLKIKHVGFSENEVITASESMIKSLPEVIERVDAFRGIRVSTREQLAFAEAAHSLKWESMDVAPIEPRELLSVRRIDDGEPTLWNTLNVVQENIIKGGIRGTSPTARAAGKHKRMTTRAVSGVDENVRLNRALWVLADKLSDHKGL